MKLGAMSDMNSPIFLAVDVDDLAKVRELVKQTAPFVGGYKLGPRLCLRYGAELISEVANSKPVFVDQKYFDIPTTMESAVRATFEAGASYTTVHAQAGTEALTRLAKLEKELSATRPFKILAVTILTSFKQEGLPPNSNSLPIKEQVSALAIAAFTCGISGIVCSPEEVDAVRNLNKSAFIVVPGIRMDSVKGDDQNRIAGPAETLRRGASALVVGRPIVEAQDPATAAKKFFEDCQRAR